MDQLFRAAAVTRVIRMLTPSPSDEEAVALVARFGAAPPPPRRSAVYPTSRARCASLAALPPTFAEPPPSFAATGAPNLVLGLATLVGGVLLCTAIALCVLELCGAQPAARLGGNRSSPTTADRAAS